VIRQADADLTGGHAIAVEGLTVRYGQVRAIHNLSLHVPYGAIYGLIGPSGAGKSTTMRVLATIQQPDAGSVVLNGIDAGKNPGLVRASVGYLPDFSGVYEALTVGEYLDFYGSIYRVPSRRRRSTTDELLELMGLADRRNAQIGSLSRGMRQKLGLARCLVHDPAILLLDEPASGMDPASRLDLRDILHELARLGKTILIASHLLAELNAICTHLGIMQSGACVAEGSVDEIIGAVAPHPLVRVQMLQPADVERAAQLLNAHPSCHELTTTSVSTLVFRFEGKQPDLAELLGRLTRNGIRVTEFSVERPTLEDVYLGLTGEGPSA
jgi:ABC-2 type transport system ATP-binding protein